MNEWTMNPDGETASGTRLPVEADGGRFATVGPIWSDVDGVRVSVDWAGDDLSASQAVALADALRRAAEVSPPA